VTSSNVDSQIRGRLAETGIRYTHGRRRVVAALLKAEGPRSAAELHQQISGSVPLSSLYRSLAVMAEADVVAQHHGPKGITRYELAEWLAGHHHHLVCIDCGTVEDIELPPSLESTLQDLVDAVADSGEFAAAGHALEVAGRCKACA
jgi:Fur family ferric uptake transcriptional regulator